MAPRRKAKKADTVSVRVAQASGTIRVTEKGELHEYEVHDHVVQVDPAHEADIRHVAGGDEIEDEPNDDDAGDGGGDNPPA